MKLPDRLKKAITRLIPFTRVTRFDVRTLDTGLARSLDADRVIQIMESAENGDLRDLFALYRDIIAGHSHLQGRFAERKEAVIGDTLTIQPPNKKDPEDQLAAAFIDAQLEACDSFEDACLHALDSSMYPVALLEKVFKPAETPVDGVHYAYQLAELVPVPHDLLDFSEGALRIRDTDDRGRPLGTSVPVDPNRYITFRVHTLTLPDQWGGPLRSLIWWYFLGTQDREWWANFLDKYGGAFLLGRYDQSDDDSRSILYQAFAAAKKLGGLVVSRQTEVEIKQAATKDNGEAFETMHRVANEEISKLILGQTLSSDAKATGMGSGVADLGGEIRQDKRQADARRLGTALRNQLFRQLLQINGLKGAAPRPIWGSVSTAEMDATAGVLEKLDKANLEVGDDALEPLSERFGFTIQRKTQATPPALPGQEPITPMSIALHAAPRVPASAADAANERVIRAAAADLSRAFGESYAKVAQIAASSTSAADFLEKLETHCANIDPVQAADILESAMLALTANGTQATATARG